MPAFDLSRDRPQRGDGWASFGRASLPSAPFGGHASAALLLGLTCTRRWRSWYARARRAAASRSVLRRLSARGWLPACAQLLAHHTAQLFFRPAPHTGRRRLLAHGLGSYPFTCPHGVCMASQKAGGHCRGVLGMWLKSRRAPCPSEFGRRFRGRQHRFRRASGTFYSVDGQYKVVTPALHAEWL